MKSRALALLENFSADNLSNGAAMRGWVRHDFLSHRGASIEFVPQLLERQIARQIWRSFASHLPAPLPYESVCFSRFFVHFATLLLHFHSINTDTYRDIVTDSHGLKKVPKKKKISPSIGLMYQTFSYYKYFVCKAFCLLKCIVIIFKRNFYLL